MYAQNPATKMIEQCIVFPNTVQKMKLFFKVLYIHTNPPFSAKDSIKMSKCISRDQIIEHMNDYNFGRMRMFKRRRVRLKISLRGLPHIQKTIHL